MRDPITMKDPITCTFRFDSGFLCGVERSHPVHKKGDGPGGSRWRGIEPYHPFNHQHSWVKRCAKCGAKEPASA